MGDIYKGYPHIFSDFDPPVHTCPHLADPLPTCPCGRKREYDTEFFSKNLTPNIHLPLQKHQEIKSQS